MEIAEGVRLRCGLCQLQMTVVLVVNGNPWPVGGCPNCAHRAWVLEKVPAL